MYVNDVFENSARGKSCRWMILACDSCQKSMKKRFCQKVADRKHHYCSRTCVSASPYVRAAKIEGNKKRFSNADERGRASERMIELWKTKGQELKQKLSDKMFERWQNEKYRTSMTAENSSHYGIPLSKEAIAKMKRTCVEKYGVTCTFQRPEIVAKSKIAAGSEVKIQKILATMKRNGTYGKSKSEDRCYDFLTSMFQNVERQKRVKRWAIDFYVQDIDTYIQFDGAYWHGLDRPLSQILEHKNKRDAGIYRTILKDQKQNEYFRDVGMKLVRLSEKDIVDIETLNSKLNSQE